jgi:hypothetical protein
MAASDDSVNSWPGLLGELNKNFLLLRDVFGYAMPGGVFFAVGLISGYLSICRAQCLLWPYHPPGWVVFVLGVVACYITGNILAGTAYMPIGVAKYIVWMIDRHWAPFQPSHAVKEPPPGSWRDWLLHNPTEVQKEMLEAGLKHPSLLDTVERRETMVLLAGSTSAALLGGWLLFYAWKPDPSCIFVLAGLILVIQFLTGLSHVRRVAKATVAANVPDPPPDPDLAKLLADMIKAATAYLNK